MRLAGAAPGGQTQRASGTSMAAALVSGVAGLLASWQLRLGRNIDVRAIKTAILTGAVRCEETAATDCQRSLGGRLDASTAFALISQGEASAMSNSNLPQTSVNPPCPQGLAGESAPADGGKSRRSQRRPHPAGDNLPVRGTTIPLPIPFETERRLVYALGQISFDFGTEARRDALRASRWRGRHHGPRGAVGLSSGQTLGSHRRNLDAAAGGNADLCPAAGRDHSAGKPTSGFSTC